MNIREKQLAADLLQQFSSDLSSRGCNDWNYPLHWTQEEKIAFAIP